MCSDDENQFQTRLAHVRTCFQHYFENFEEKPEIGHFGFWHPYGFFTFSPPLLHIFVNCPFLKKRTFRFPNNIDHFPTLISPLTWYLS